VLHSRLYKYPWSAIQFFEDRNLTNRLLLYKLPRHISLSL